MAWHESSTQVSRQGEDAWSSWVRKSTPAASRSQCSVAGSHKATNRLAKSFDQSLMGAAGCVRGRDAPGNVK